MRAAVYTRISKDRHGDELGVARQEKDCLALCEREGWSIAGIFTDNDVSAYSGKRRPKFEELRALLRSGGADVLVAWHPDRLTRHPRELEDLIDLIESSKSKVRTVMAGEYDLSSASGRATARIIGAIARAESEQKSERNRRKHEELAAAGKRSGGGSRGYGYDDGHHEIVRAEAAVVREAAKRVLAGEAIRSVVADFNDRDLRNSTGRPWNPTSLRRTLMAGRIAGLRTHRGAIVAKGDWPAIITEDQHRRLVAVLGDPGRLKHRGVEPKLLTGLIECGRCREKMVSRPRSNHRKNGTEPIPAYVCAKGLGYSGCGQISTLGEPVELLVVEAALTRLATPDLERQLRRQDDGPADDAASQLEEVDRKLGELGEMWAAGELDAAGWRAARAVLERKLAEINSVLAAQSRHSALAEFAAGSVRKAWPKLPSGKRRAVLAAVIDAVVIAPVVRGRNRFDPERVSIRWRA